MFSRACAAFLNGEKLVKDTIFPNFARSVIESWTAWDLDPISSCSLASNMAYPEAVSNSKWETIVSELVVAVVRDVEQALSENLGWIEAGCCLHLFVRSALLAWFITTEVGLTHFTGMIKLLCVSAHVY